MLSQYQNPQLLPGYFSYVQGEEKDAEVAEQKLDENDSFLRQLLTRVMYSIITNPDQYYRLGLNRFMSACHNELDDDQIRGINPILIYFYNRQLIVQMTSMPKLFPSREIHIPLDREPNTEIQVDILALTELQVVANFNMPYLVVVLEPFSRFMWSYPTARLLASYVRKAFYLALSRPGIGHDYYLHIRDKIKRVVVDGGSEFKDTFQGNFRQAFPNAVLVRSFAKSKTGGRPTNTGPVEAGIATLRRVLRDHELGVHPSFLKQSQSGFRQVLDAYNSMPQTTTLDSVSPTETVESILGRGTPGLIPHLQNYMKQGQEKKLDRKFQIMQDTGIDKEENVWSTDIHGPVAYRLYLPPNHFSKQVTLRVSLDAYVIETFHGGQNHPYVDIVSYGHNGGQAPKRLKNIHMKQLVLVKAPINDGPQTIRDNLQRDIEALRVIHTPRDVSLAFEITPEIRQAVGQAAPALEDQRLDNNPVVREQRHRALPQHLAAFHVPPPDQRGNGQREPREPRARGRGRGRG